MLFERENFFSTERKAPTPLIKQFALSVLNHVRDSTVVQASWNELLHRFDVGEGTILVLEFLNDASGRCVTAFDCIADFAGSTMAIDVWCHQKSGASGDFDDLTPYPNEDALIAHTKDCLAKAVKKIY
ncbi:unnamed protein product [Rhizopus stolonifer]